MAAPSKNWTDILDTQIDADSPIDVTLMTEIRDDLVYLKEWLGKNYTAAIDHSHDGVNSALISTQGTLLYSFYTSYPFVFDDFLMESIIGWTNEGGTAAILTGAGVYNGIVRASSTAGAWSGVSQFTCLPFMFHDGNTVTFEANVKAVNALTVNSFIIIGLADANPGAQPVPTNSIQVYWDINASKYGSKTISGGVVTATLWDLGPTTAIWHKLKIVATSTSVQFYYNGTLKASHTTNIPTVHLGSAMIVKDTSGGGTTTYDCDYICCYSNMR